MIDLADEIELIDISPQELRKRLADGKVYLNERAAAAASSFFRDGNLRALREIALRIATEKADRELRDFLSAKSISGPWKAGERFLVAVGTSPFSRAPHPLDPARLRAHAWHVDGCVHRQWRDPWHGGAAASRQKSRPCPLARRRGSGDGGDGCRRHSSPRRAGEQRHADRRRQAAWTSAVRFPARRFARGQADPRQRRHRHFRRSRGEGAFASDPDGAPPGLGEA